MRGWERVSEASRHRSEMCALSGDRACQGAGTASVKVLRWEGGSLVSIPITNRHPAQVLHMHQL